MIDAIYYTYQNIVSKIDVKWEFGSKRYIVSQFIDNVLDARIICPDLDSAKLESINYTIERRSEWQ